MPSGKKTIIGIIGTIGSGKDTAALYISERLQIPTFQISQVLKDIAKERGIEPIRENLIALGSDLVKEKGSGFLSELALDRIEGDKGIITGIRVPDVIEYFKYNSHFILLTTEADPEIRFQRSTARNKLGEAGSLEEFLENEKRENSPPNAQRLFECLEQADYTISNNSDLASFHEKIDLFLEKNKLLI
ncbi:MAG: AAA family ATPase [Patescibacteria group bacterium]